MTDKIKPEVYEKIEAVMQQNLFCLDEYKEYSSSPGYLKLDNEKPKRNLKSIGFLSGSAIYKAENDLYKDFKQKLEKEISSWTDDLFINLYEHSKSTDINSILSGIDCALRYTTHPSVLDKITEKTIKKYSKYVQNEEKFYLYFEKVIAHPYWQKKQDFLKQFLIDTNHIVTLNELFPSDAKVDIIKVKTPATATFEVDFSLMPTPKSNLDSNCKPHTFSSQSAFLWKMIRDFHTFNIDESPIKGIYADHTTPRDGIKRVTIFADTYQLANAFAEVFFDMFKEQLKSNSYVGEKSSSGFDSKMILSFIENLKIISINKDLSESLETKETKVKAKKL